jgi:hypothetical protein
MHVCVCGVPEIESVVNFFVSWSWPFQVWSSSNMTHIHIHITNFFSTAYIAYMLYVHITYFFQLPMSLFSTLGLGLAAAAAA